MKKLAKPKFKYGITEREMEVLELVIEGLSNPEIGNALIIEESTAHSHVANILKKLNVSNRTQAAVKAVKENLIYGF